jgi:Uma2 family endonuclease
MAACYNARDARDNGGKTEQHMAKLLPTWGEIVDPHSTLTPDDLLRLGEDDGAKYELYEGVLVREMTSPGHADICQRLGGELYIYARNAGYPNRILQNALFDFTPPGAATRITFAPDISIMRGSAAPPWNVPHVAPLLAVEVISESQTLAGHAQKAQSYLQAGVDEVWLIDHKSRAVEIWNAAGMKTLNDTQVLTSALLPGFSTSVRYLLDG